MQDDSVKQELQTISHNFDMLLGSQQRRSLQLNPLSNEFLQLSERDNKDAVANWLIQEFFNEIAKEYDDGPDSPQHEKHHHHHHHHKKPKLEKNQVLRLSIALTDEESNTNNDGTSTHTSHVILERALSQDIQNMLLGLSAPSPTSNSNSNRGSGSSQFLSQSSITQACDEINHDVNSTCQDRSGSDLGSCESSSTASGTESTKQAEDGPPTLRRSLSKFGEFVKKMMQRRRVIEIMQMEAIYSRAKAAFVSSTTDPIKHFLAENDQNWEIDIFDFEQLCQSQKTSSFLALSSFFILPFCRSLRISSRKVLSFLMDINANYLASSQVIYHNALHGADVLFTSHFFLKCIFFNEILKLSDLEKFAILIASASHDVGHPGFNNTYQINTESELSMKYNDQSVLENFHTSLTFSLLKKKANNFYDQMSLPKRKHFRALVIKLILGTDMKKHSSQVAVLKNLANELICFTNQTNDIYKQNTNKQNNNKQNHENINENININDVQQISKSVHGSISPSITSISESSKLELLEILLHVADISNPARTFHLSEKWAYLISEEFFRQGDRELKRGLDISPLCDRNNTNINESQIGFITYVVAPLFDTWSKFVPEISMCLKTMEESKILWKNYKPSESEKQS